MWAKFQKTLANNFLLVGTLAGVAVGFVIGFSVKPFEPSETVESLVAFPGELYLRALQMLIFPLVIFSLILGSSSVNAKTNGKIALRTFTYFILTSLFNAIMGIFLVVIIHPGDTSIHEGLGNVPLGVDQRKNTMLDNFMDLGRNLVPDNVITVFFEQSTTVYRGEGDDIVKQIGSRRAPNALGIIALSISVGIVLSTMGDKGKPFMSLCKAGDEIVTALVSAMISLTPVGVASMISAKVLEVQDMGTILAALGVLILTVVIGIVFYQLIIMQLIYLAIIRKNPYRFYIGVLPAAITGFAADSSAVALPITLKCLDKMKIDERISRFVAPIGVTVNMDGTAMFVCIASIFIAQMNNIALGFGDYVNICISGVAVSVAAAGAPSASLTLLFIILNAINAPIRDIGLLFAVDWLVDRIRTTNNVLGDCYTAAIVEHFSKDELLNEISPVGDQNAKSSEDNINNKKNINEEILHPV